VRLLVACLLLAGCSREQSTDTAPDDSGHEPECVEDEECGEGRICEGGCVDGDRDNSFDTATAILQNQPATGEINPPGDADYFVYTSLSDEWLRIQTVTGREDGLLDSVVSVYAQSGALHLAMDDYATGQVLTYDSLAFVYLPRAGDWYLKVEDRSTWYGDEVAAGGADYDYELELKTFGSTTRETDDALNPSATVDITSGSSIWAVGVNLEEAGDSDWIAVTMPWSDTNLEVHGMSAIAGSDAEARVQAYQPDGTLVMSKDDVGPAGEAIYFNAQEGSYLVEATDTLGGGGADTWYVLFFRTRAEGSSYGMEVEPNDDGDTPQVLEEQLDTTDSGTEYRWYSVQGALSDDGDEDWFQVSAEADEYLSCRCSGESFGALGDPAIDVIDDSDEVLQTVLDGEDNAPDLSNLALPSPGITRLRIWSEDAQYGPGSYYRCKIYLTPFEIAE